MSHSLMDERLHVAVGVIYNATRDKILISKRCHNQDLAGFWEFPGGKVENGETSQSALARELFEELGIVVNQAESLMNISHDYPDKKVLLDVWKVNNWSGNVTRREKQEIAWVAINELNHYAFPSANKQIIKTISLPVIYVISQDTYTSQVRLLSAIRDCFEQGLKLFQLRLKQRQYDFQLINEIKKLASFYHAKFILNGTVEDIQNYHTDGIHFNKNELFKYSSRPIPKNYILGGSCHNEAELMQAILLDVDYVFISPVCVTSSHPSAKTLGWDRFNQLAKKINVPVYALGGLSENDLNKARISGAHGIAMLSAFWRKRS